MRDDVETQSCCTFLPPSFFSIAAMQRQTPTIQKFTPHPQMKDIAK
jgi:hypothetical protein